MKYLKVCDNGESLRGSGGKVTIEESLNPRVMLSQGLNALFVIKFVT